MSDGAAEKGRGRPAAVRARTTFASWTRSLRIAGPHATCRRAPAKGRRTRVGVKARTTGRPAGEEGTSAGERTATWRTRGVRARRSGARAARADARTTTRKSGRGATRKSGSGVRRRRRRKARSPRAPAYAAELRATVSDTPRAGGGRVIGVGVHRTDVTMEGRPCRHQFHPLHPGRQSKPSR